MMNPKINKSFFPIEARFRCYISSYSTAKLQTRARTMRYLIAILAVAYSNAAAAEPVTVNIESIGRSSAQWVRLVVKATNNTPTAYGTVFFRCTAFTQGRAVGTQLGIISNLRPNGVAFNQVSIEVSQRAENASCVFERIAFSG